MNLGRLSRTATTANTPGLAPAARRISVGHISNSDGRAEESLAGRFFLLGFLAGAATMAFGVCIIIMYISSGDAAGAVAQLAHRYYPVYRGMFLVAFFFVCYGVVLFIWHRSHVNYASAKILDVDKEYHNYKYVLTTSAVAMIVMCTAFMFYVFSLLNPVAFPVATYTWPLIGLLLAMMHLLAPCSLSRMLVAVTEQESNESDAESRPLIQRYMMLRTLGCVLLSPFSQMNFARGFLADVLTSMPKVFADVNITVCLYVTGEAFDQSWNPVTKEFDLESECSTKKPWFYYLKMILAVLPFWVRLMQCARAFYDKRKVKDAANGLKYCSSISVVLLSFTTYSSVWLAVSICSTVYGCSWDIFMDWGLGPAGIRRRLHGPEFGDEEHPSMLRKVLTYERWVYYFAVCTNVMAKCCWAIVISPGQKVLEQHVVLFLGCVELMRRAQWAVLRIEWEDVHTLFARADAPSATGSVAGKGDISLSAPLA